MEKPQIFLSFILIVGGLILIADVSLSKITGNIINNSPAVGFSSIGFLFLILGIVLFMVNAEGKLERNLAQEIKRSGRIVDNPRELIHIAKKSGYVLGKEVKEGIPVYDDFGRYITVIPIHKVSGGVSRNIISELARGESNFRKRNY